MRNGLVAILLALAVLWASPRSAAAQTEWVYHDRGDRGFALWLPADWQEVPSDNPAFAARVPGEPTQIAISVGQAPPGTTFDLLVLELENLFADDDRTFLPIEHWRTALPAGEAEQFRFHTREVGDGRYINYAYLLLRDETVYLLWLSTPEEWEDYYAPLFGDIATWFEITGPRAIEVPVSADPPESDPFSYFASCDDFTYQEDAQRVLDADPLDFNHLDEDGNGRACDELPSRAAPSPSVAHLPG